MNCLDTSANPRISDLLETLREMSHVTRAEDLVRSLSRSLHRWVHNDALLAVSRRNLPEGQYKITRRVRYTKDGPVSSTTNPWKDWDRLPTYSGGFIGEMIARDTPEVIHDLDLRDDPVLGDEYAEFNSCVAIPLFDAGESLNWNIGFRNDPQGFSLEDLELTMMIVNLVGRTTLNLMNAQTIERLHYQLRNELEKIASIQRALLPAKLPDIPGLDIAASYQPCELAGGDYYDFTPLDRDPITGQPNPDGRWGVIIADVSGHGASAAVVMAMMQAIVHAYPDYERVCADRLLAHLNEQFVRKHLDHNFVTAFCADYDPKARLLQYACAGHYPPRIKKPGHGSPVTPLPIHSGLPLGIDDDSCVQQESITLEPGDTLVLFTDGIIESFNHRREMFGTEGLDAAMHSCSGEPKCIIESISRALAEHEGGIKPADDQTIVAVKVRG